MTDRKSTTKKGKGSKGKASDELTAERIRAILSDPNTPSSVAGKLQRLVSKLGELMDAPAPDTADFYADTFLYAAEAVRGGMPNTPGERAEAAPVFADVACYAERHEPKEYKAARRVVAAYDAQDAREGEKGNGCYFFMEHYVDSLMSGASDNLMCGSPRDERRSEAAMKGARRRARRGPRGRGAARSRANNQRAGACVQPRAPAHSHSSKPERT
jgi:hypothetical protein